MTDVRPRHADFTFIAGDHSRVRSHRAPARLSRRGLIGLAALAAVPAGVLAVRAPGGESPDGDTAPTAPEGAEPPAAVTPVPARSSTPANTLKGGGPVPYVRDKVLLGSYLNLVGMSGSAALRLRREQLDRSPRIVHVFYGWTDNLPQRLSDLPDAAYPLVSWRGADHASILAGEHDDMIARNARRLRRFGRPLLLRWGWEMNGDWYAWGGAKNDHDPGGYVRCWRRLHDIFAGQGADNVSWVWSPNWNNSPAESWNTMDAYYPGDEYVDWVGVSGYNLHRETPDTLFGPVYRAYTGRKPLMITEVGAVDRGGSTKADWIELFAEWCREHPKTGGVAWFDTDTHPGYHEKWRIDTDAASLAAYRKMATDPRFKA
jgi:hypothetical protein